MAVAAAITVESTSCCFKAACVVRAWLVGSAVAAAVVAETKVPMMSRMIHQVASPMQVET